MCLDAGAEYLIKSTTPPDTCQSMISFDSDVMTFGNTSFPMYLRGSEVDVISEDRLNLTASGGEVDISSSGAYNIVLNPGTTGNVDVDGASLLLDNGKYLMGYQSSYKNMIGFNSTVLEIGSSTNNIEFVTSGDIRLARYGSSVRMQWSGGTWAEVITMENTDQFCVGFLTSGTFVRGGADSDGDEILKFQGRLTTTPTTSHLDPGQWCMVKQGGNVRLAYNDAGTIVESANFT
jgi:hypothetical protein